MYWTKIAKNYYTGKNSVAVRYFHDDFHYILLYVQPMWDDFAIFTTELLNKPLTNENQLKNDNPNEHKYKNWETRDLIKTQKGHQTVSMKWI